MHVMWLIDIIWRDSFTYVRWLIHTYDMYVTSSFIIYDVVHWRVWHWWVKYMTWLIDVRDMNRSYSLVYATILIHIYDMTHWFMCCDSCIYMAWLVYVPDINWLCQAHKRVMPYIYMSHVYMNECFNRKAEGDRVRDPEREKKGEWSSEAEREKERETHTHAHAYTHIHSHSRTQTHTQREREEATQSQKEKER